MLSSTRFRAIVSGRERGPVAQLARGALRAAEVPYTLAVRWRNRRYDAQRAAICRVAVPIVSVGNLTLGGTGKTPMVEWLARWLVARGVRVGLISRGYGAKSGGLNDEALELAERLPGVPHVLDCDRVRAARRAIDEHGCRLLVLDDGFQHRRLARDLDVVMVDALEPFGFGHVFPRGTLREPLQAWGRADVIALARADLIDTAGRAAIRCEVQRYAPQATWLEVAHEPRVLQSVNGRQLVPEALTGRRVAAFCGIGNPAGFARLLASCGYAVTAWREFADHHHYGPPDLAALDAWAGAADAAAVVCTQKDLVKLDRTRLGGKPLWALAIGLRILSGQAMLEDRLMAVAQMALAQQAA